MTQILFISGSTREGSTNTAALRTVITLPGSLKNLLDWLVGSGELNDKPVAWLSVAHQGRGEGALATLETVLGYVDARLLESACARIPVGRDAVATDGTVVGPQVRAALREMLANLVRTLSGR